MARKTDWLDATAEGRCNGIPYNTEIISSEGVAIHFWLGERPDETVVPKLEATAKRHRDIVVVTWSAGEPVGFWANSDME